MHAFDYIQGGVTVSSRYNLPAKRDSSPVYIRMFIRLADIE
jgi:hypothetical protein